MSKVAGVVVVTGTKIMPGPHSSSSPRQEIAPWPVAGQEGAGTL